MNPLFQAIQITKPKRNAFDLSHEKKLSLNMGSLVPVLLEEYVPGDTFKVNTECLARLAPMIAPMMHRVNLYMHYFAVPNRLVWNEWEKFITGGESGVDNPTYPKLEITAGNYPYFEKGSLADYLGLPPAAAGMAQNMNVSALPFRAYQLIYNEYYRDQNLESKISFDLGSITGNDVVALSTLRTRAWEKDYFTSALTTAQKGGVVNLPTQINYNDPTIVRASGSGANPNNGALGVDAGVLEDSMNNSVRLESLDSIDVTINDLRTSYQLQRWLERNARAGSRYVESILSHFGVKSSDSRLQRPEYLGGGKQPIVISEVLQTSKTDTSPQGNMAGHGISVGNTNQFTKTFDEHGYVIGILSILPRTTYQDGIPKTFLRDNKLEYFWPEFANLGEEPIMKQELYFDKGSATNKEETFGYQSRYASYKFAQSTVHGDFRDNLSYWHMGRIFTSMPGLNSTFIKSNPTHRVFAVTDPQYHKIYVQLYNDVKAIRPMPIFGTPSW